MLRAVTIDDNPLFLAVLNDLLTRFPGVSVVASASNGSDGLAAAAEFSPDIVFVDIKMPGLNGLEVAQFLRDQHPAIRVVVMSIMDEEECTANVSAVGAERFVCKRNLFGTLPAIMGCSLAAPALQ